MFTRFTPNLMKRFSHTSAAPVSSIHDHLLKISWTADWDSKYHYVWLRDNCQCPQCIHPTTRQKLHSSAHVPLDIKPTKIEWSVDKRNIKISWPESVDTLNVLSRAHQSEFDAAWLKANCYTQKLGSRLLNDHQHVLWDKKMVQSKDLWVNYADIMQSATVDQKEPQLYRMLSLLQQYGLVFIRGVPTNDTEVEKVALRIGPIRETFYGRSWDVKSVANAKNIAYTSLFLGLHMDLMYFESPPGLQFLHCLEASVAGGDSIFLDSYRAIDRFKSAHPDAFQTLVHTPVTFHYRNSGHYLRFRRPMIEVDDDNQPLQVYYAPPFQGPLEVEPDRVRAFYDAFSKLDGFMEDREHVFEYRLQPGDCVVFANRRVLHGRLAFNSTTGQRHLKGTYVDWDAMKDRLSVLRSIQ